MTRRASILIDFDVPAISAADVGIWLRRQTDWLRNVEVTVLDDGAPPTLPAAPAPGPAHQPIPKGPSQ